MSSAQKPTEPGTRPSQATTPPWLIAIRWIVAVYRGYLGLHWWSMLLALIVLVAIGKLVTNGGLLLLAMIGLYGALYLLDKWLRKHDAQ